jgi:hypothetical protein
MLPKKTCLIVLVGLCALLLLLASAMYKADTSPRFSLRHWADDSGQSWLRFRIQNPRWLDCLVSISVGGQNVTNVLVFAASGAVVDVPESVLGTPVLVTGKFETPGPFHLTVMEVIGLRRKRGGVFAKDNKVFSVEQVRNDP